MSEFIQTLLKGLYPPYLLFALFGIVLRMRRRQWRRRDSALLAVFLLYEVLAAFQVFFFYGELSTAKRYLQVALPLYLPFAASGMLEFFHWMARWRLGARCAGMLLAAIFIGSVINVYAYIAKERRPGKKRLERLASIEAAELIRNDWTAGPPLLLMKCDHYQPGRRPIVMADGPQAGYLCGGQGYNEDFCRPFGILPDYAVTQEPLGLPQYAFVKDFSVDGHAVYVYRLTNNNMEKAK